MQNLKGAMDRGGMTESGYASWSHPPPVHSSLPTSCIESNSDAIAPPP